MADRSPSTHDADRFPLADPQAGAVALDGGAIAVCATETVYGIAASAAHEPALRRLGALVAGEGARGVPAGLAWHVASAATVRAALDAADATPTDAAWRRFDALAPGPVTAEIELAPGAAARVAEALGIAEGVVTRGNRLLVRVPDHPVAQAVLGRASGPIVMAAAPGAAQAGATLSGVLDALADVDDGAGVGAVCAGPPEPVGTPSTHIDIERDGSWTLTSDGAMSRRDIERRLDTLILFVCTGNTCRSPMAAAIARRMLDERPMPGGGTVRVESAGVAASSGASATPEAVVAARALGADASGHASQPLTRDLLDRASVVFTLTAGHKQAVDHAAPDAAPRVQTLDAEGRDVPDPIGSPQDVYDETALVIASLIERRLVDAGLIEPSAGDDNEADGTGSEA